MLVTQGQGLKGHKDSKSKGSKRKYAQKKRNAYKVDSKGQYGGLLINPTRLINEMVVEACDPSTGAVVYERQGDKGIVDLLTKRCNPKGQYSSKATQIFKDLNKLANIPVHKSSGKAKLLERVIGGAIFSDFKDLENKLITLTGSIDADEVAMSYSWYNVSSSYNNNKLKYSHDSGNTWHEIELPDGNFAYSQLNAYIQRELEGANHKKKGIELKFVPALFKCLIGLEDGYQVDLRTGDFGDLIGFTKKVVTTTSYGDKLPDITRSVDNIYIRTNIISDSVVGDADGKYTIHNIDDDNVAHSATLQEGEGIFDTLKNVGTKIAAKVTGKAAKEIAKKAATKAFEKGAEQIGEKTGQLIGEKIYDKFRKMPMASSSSHAPLEAPIVEGKTPQAKALSIGEQLAKDLQADMQKELGKDIRGGYEDSPYDLNTPLQTAPANNTYQKKKGYKFTVDTKTASESVADWYNAYFEIDFKITKMDNTTYGAADAAAIINGGFSMIKAIKVDFEKVNVLDLSSANHAANMKNLTEFSKEHSDQVGPPQFHYLDTASGAIIQKYTTLAIPIAAGQDVNRTPTDNADYNEGFTKRKTLLTTGAENNIHLPLNRFGFFDSLEEQIPPNAKVDFDVTLEDDNEVLFRSNAAAAGRYIVTKFCLWVPMINMNDAGQKIYADNFLKPHTWTYKREQISDSGALRQKNGKFNIISAVNSPRHVFVWVLNASKFNDQEQNMFVFNTYNIANARYFTKAQLRVENGTAYPNKELDPSSELARAWKYFASYSKLASNNLNGPAINMKQFQDLYGVLYFDLTKQPPEIIKAATRLDFEYSLNNTTNADYHIYAMILNDEEISVDVMSGKALIRNVTLSDNQKRKLAKAFNEKSAITIRLSHNELSGSDEMMLTQTQIKKIKKAINSGKGVDLKISKTQMTKVAQKGGSLFSSLLALGTKLLPKAMNLATKALPGLATGALSSLGNFATDKILGAGQSGGMLIPNSNIVKLLPYVDALSKKQKQDLSNALHSGGDLKMKPTKSQSGGFLGTLLASIGVLILLKALTGSGNSRGRGSHGSGLHVRAPKKSGKGMQNRPYWDEQPIFFPPGLGEPVPTIGRGGKKKQKGQGLLLGKDSPFNGIPLLGALL
ncbi:hypothetical protein AWC38_SpisGene14566 [Stylophora pistillata]|uniref:Uncharacterized protein n=1 Tax=Stylophora pistillata TaxID=50429 RepID=A0A2B4RXI5_STYPI|nr:hypothetical protein AWC38_SpisGene14566 [Stylophora pistillata]